MAQVTGWGQGGVLEGGEMQRQRGRPEPLSQGGRHAGRKAQTMDRWTYKPIDRQTDKPIDKQTSPQTDMKTDIHK